MPIGKSKISDMDFGSFENTIDKNIETDKASDKFDQQLQAYKDAGNSLTLAKSGVEMATASMHEAKDKLSEASDKANTVTKAIEAYIGKVKNITVKAKVDDTDMDFGSFENTIDKNIETDKASDKFDQQLQAYKDAGNSLTLAKSSVEMATAYMHEAKDKLSEASDKANTVTKAIEAYIGKVKDITVKAKIDDADMEQAINNRKKLIENESKLLEDHRKKNKEILTRHFYDMSNMMSRNEGVWLSNGWVKTLLWIFLPCFLYTVISIVYFVASYIDK